jgi:hypothetical protein
VATNKIDRNWITPNGVIRLYGNSELREWTLPSFPTETYERSEYRMPMLEDIDQK